MSADRPTREPRYVADVPGGNLVLDLFVINQHVGALLTRAFDGLEITPAQYAVYSTIGRKSLTPSAIGDLLGIHAPTLSGHLATMEGRGDLLRVRSTSDRRSFTVSLTVEGLTRLDQARARFRRALRATHALLGDVDEVERIRSLLLTVDTAIGGATAHL